MKFFTKCSNYASDTCPCELAEEGKSLPQMICVLMIIVGIIGLKLLAKE